MLTMKRVVKLGVNAILTPFGCEVRTKNANENVSNIKEGALGFNHYLSEAKKLGMDVNDWEEKYWDGKSPYPFSSKQYFLTFKTIVLFAI